MKVLLIEDERDLAAIIKMGLEEAGFDVALAHDGKAGLEMAGVCCAQVIVLDIMLPEMDGLAVLKQLRMRKIQTPVILLTARESFHGKQKGAYAEADDCLMKPFAFKELVAKIRKLSKKTTARNAR